MENNTKICPECGAAFVPRYTSQLCCSEKCKRNRRNQRQRKWRSGDNDEGPFACAIRESRSVSTKTIMRAAKKPDGVSAIRWRIELRRRAAKSVYDNSFSPAPDPDLLRATALG